jgi:multidrug efflux pump
MPPYKAALAGSKEIGFAVLAMTVTLASVYAPIGFMTGRTGKLFTEFAWALAGAVLVSGFVALSLSPMMCSKMLHHQERHNFVYRVIERAIDGLTNGYRRALAVTLGARWLVVLAGLLVAGSAYFLFTTLKSELAPTEDRGVFMGIGIAPEGSTIDFTDHYAKMIEAIYRKVPELEHYFVVTGYPVVSQTLHRQAGAVRGPDLAALQGAAGHGRQAAGSGAPVSRDGQPRQRPQAQQA